MTGQEGEMMPGPEADPGMPEGSTVSRENGQQAPNEGIPQEMMSPLSAQQQGGGFNVLYLARRAATQLSKMDEMTKQQELGKMQLSSPQLYSTVLQLLNEEKGSQEDPLDPMQSPQPKLKPSRRAAPTGA